MKIPSVDEQRKSMERLLSENRYAPSEDGKTPKKDKHGMTIVEPEPDDPDDE